MSMVQGDPGTLVASIREAVWSVNRYQTTSEIIPLADLVEREAARPRFLTVLLGGFAALALGLAALGLYGVISFMVNRRPSELGIRIASGGASQRGPQGGRRGRPSHHWDRLGGRAVGGVLAQPPHDDRALRGGAQRSDHVRRSGGVVAVISLLATLVPALRALRIDPVTALRSE